MAFLAKPEENCETPKIKIFIQKKVTTKGQISSDIILYFTQEGP